MLLAVRGLKRSRTAQYVACVRAVLNGQGVVDDPYAVGMLSRGMRAVAATLALPPLRSRTKSPFFASLASRIAFFDREVGSALDAGVKQVVILGAGYDSRAWRFAQSGVRFFEVDHPVTQEDKKRRAPGGGPTYVPADLAQGSLVAALTSAGFDSHRPALFLLEGVTMYLNERGVYELLAELADQAAPGSQLAVNFAAPPGTGAAADRRRQRALRLLGRVGGEPHRFFLRASEARSFVSRAGWHVDQATTLREIATEFLCPTNLRTAGINPEASAVGASTMSARRSTLRVPRNAGWSTARNRVAGTGVEPFVQDRSAAERVARWSLAIVTLVLMASMGGGFLLLPALIPGHLWAARRSSGSLGRLGWSVLPAGSLAMLTWAAVYVTVGEAKPAIWLVPTLALLASFAAVHRLVEPARPVSA